MSLVHVVRHGRPAATWGDAEADPGLDPQGLEQALAVAGRLLALPEGSRPSRVVSSPLRRCRETAAPLARELGVEMVIDPRVGEIPTPVGLPEAERPAWLREAFEGEWAAIKGDLDYVAWTHGVAKAVAEYAGAAVFSHFVALNAAVSVANGEARVMNFRPDHCSITTFEVADGRLILNEKGREALSKVL